MIKFTHGGNFRKTDAFFNAVKKANYKNILERYAKEGVAALENATPKDTGLTADSWGYQIMMTRTGASVIWTNRNLVEGVPIVILLQYGHGTGTGGYVQGRDFINPPMRPLFDAIAENLWKEVTSP